MHQNIHWLSLITSKLGLHIVILFISVACMSEAMKIEIFYIYNKRGHFLGLGSRAGKWVQASAVDLSKYGLFVRRHFKSSGGVSLA
ncbi:uncharacterized protein EV420DRAFT_1525439 [Desarmillaria tabescens]|uniref:Uncharacterized protein n=1 Tax=Armillaria tabescens TaxID=1929756 RepID=A0AA39NBE3_ARMTA|nr:uncharacterized protein EV420DRAFT_1525439 [Desarmillaria tabescens]KAK0462535.1 hypothetical protein EV420DRAFT_1525439 [Desarmillaria tabescens]